MAAILPCPFCGSTNVQRHLVSQDERSGYNQTITYRCAACGGNVTEHSKHDKNGWIDDVPADFEARALAKWNARAAACSAVGGAR